MTGHPLVMLVRAYKTCTILVALAAAGCSSDETCETDCEDESPRPPPADPTAFGPCGGFSDDFSTFHPASSTDSWDTLNVQTIDQNDRTVMFVLPEGHPSSAWLKTTSGPGHCFASIRFEQIAEGSVTLSIRGEHSGFVRVSGGPSGFSYGEVPPGSTDLTLENGGSGQNAVLGVRIRLERSGIAWDTFDGTSWSLLGGMVSEPWWLSDNLVVQIHRDEVVEPGESDVVLIDDFNIDAP